MAALPPPHRTASPAAASAATRAKPKYVAMMAAGLISAVIAIFMMTLSMQMVATAMTHGQFVADQLKILNYNTSTTSTRGSRSASGEVVSSGEVFQISNRSILDLDEARMLADAGRLEGHLIAVRYLPPGPIASTFDYIVPFRVQTAEQFDLGFSWILFLANVAFAIAAIRLIRTAVHGIKHDPAVP